MIMDKKNIIAIAAVVIIAIGVIVYNCVSCSKQGNLDDNLKVATVEQYTETTSVQTTETSSESTTYVIRPSQNVKANNDVSKIKAPKITPNTGSNSNYVPSNVKTASPDKYINYKNKRLAVNFSMDSLKTILGEPIVFAEETTQVATENMSEEQTEPNTESVEVTTKAVENFTNTHRYREFIISTKVENGTEIVKDIRVISKNVGNAMGYSPIDKYLYEITLAYGQPSYTDWNICKYNIDNKSELYFRIVNEKVESWGIAAK